MFKEALLANPGRFAFVREVELESPDQGEFQPILVALKAWLKFAPKDTTALERFADLAGRLGDHALAADLLQQAQRLDPANAALPFKRGNALNDRVNPHQALAAYRGGGAPRWRHVGRACEHSRNASEDRPHGEPLSTASGKCTSRTTPAIRTPPVLPG